MAVGAGTREPQDGIISCDFADVCTIMRDSGVAHMGIGVGKGENAAQDAVRAAIESPLLETSISGAANVLLNITGGTEFSLVDMGEVSGIVREMVSQDATIIVGTAVEENMKDEIKVTLIATGLDVASKRNIENPFAGSTQQQAPSAPDFSAVKPSGYNMPKNDIFSRRVDPGISNVDVPSFLRPKNK